MDCSYLPGEPLEGEHGAVIVALFEDALGDPPRAALDGALDGLFSRLVAAGDFAGTAKELSVLYPAAGKPARVVACGLGKRAQANLETLRRAVGEATRRAQALGAGDVVLWAHEGLLGLAEGDATALGRALLDAALLAAFSDESHKPKAAEERAKRKGAGRLARAALAGPAAHGEALERAAREAGAIARGVRTARELGNLPGNEGTPRGLAQRAQAMAEEVGLHCEVLDEGRLAALGMGAFLGVAQGSAEPPRLILLEHGRDRDERPIVLVGKAVTFDTGGISIKPADRMEEMKFDKCGGAAVIGLCEAAARLGLKRRIVGLVASAENMPSASAQRPGDVRRALDGQTIEIINTDAEGRLLLADTIAYACRDLDPALVIDLATLTGACVVALGAVYAGLFASDDALAEALLAAGRATGERLWRLPLDADYDELIKSHYADVKNSGGRWGGAITAARFVQRFVGEGVPWAHLDIAGTAWVTDKKPYYEPGATGFGVRLLAAWFAGLADPAPGA